MVFNYGALLPAHLSALSTHNSFLSQALYACSLCFEGSSSYSIWVTANHPSNLCFITFWDNERSLWPLNLIRSPNTVPPHSLGLSILALTTNCNHILVFWNFCLMSAFLLDCKLYEDRDDVSFILHSIGRTQHSVWHSWSYLWFE